MNKLRGVLFAGALVLGSVTAMAQEDKTPPQPADQDKAEAAYRMGMASQRQHDLNLQWAQMPLTNLPPATPEESKAIKEAATKAKAAYASMSPEEKAMYKKGMRDQRQMDRL